MGLKNLPLASGRKHVQALERLGWRVRTQNGSHIILVKPGHPANLSIPDHREVKRSLLAGQLKTAGVSEEEYLRAFKKK